MLFLLFKYHKCSFCTLGKVFHTDCCFFLFFNVIYVGVELLYNRVGL